MQERIVTFLAELYRVAPCLTSNLGNNFRKLGGEGMLEFGERESQLVVNIRALFGIKSSGWHARFIVG